MKEALDQHQEEAGSVSVSHSLSLRRPPEDSSKEISQQSPTLSSKAASVKEDKEKLAHTSQTLESLSTPQVVTAKDPRVTFSSKRATATAKQVLTIPQDRTQGLCPPETMQDINAKLKRKSLRLTKSKDCASESNNGSQGRGSFQVAAGESPLFENILSPIASSRGAVEERICPANGPGRTPKESTGKQLPMQSEEVPTQT